MKQYQIHLPNKADYTAAILFLEARGITNSTNPGAPMEFVDCYHRFYPWLVIDNPKETAKPTYGANGTRRHSADYTELNSLTELFELILNPAPRPVEIQLSHGQAVVGPNGVTVGCTTFGFDKLDEIVRLFEPRRVMVGSYTVMTDPPRNLSWPGGMATHDQVLAIVEAAKQFRS